MLQKLAPKNKVYAVITGDIVGSTKLSPTEMKGVRAAIISIRETIKNFDAFNQFWTREIGSPAAWNFPKAIPGKSFSQIPTPLCASPS